MEVFDKEISSTNLNQYTINGNLLQFATILCNTLHAYMIQHKEPYTVHDALEHCLQKLNKYDFIKKEKDKQDD